MNAQALADITNTLSQHAVEGSEGQRRCPRCGESRAEDAFVRERPPFVGRLPHVGACATCRYRDARYKQTQRRT